MPARLLAYGGTSFSERRRIGLWPAVPEATLRDSYGLQASAWCYGMGILSQQPFLILRQRQNMESRGGYPFSLLLDPGEAMWERFEWNAAALIASLLELNSDLLFRTPESLSADALEPLLGALSPRTRAATASIASDVLAAAAITAEPIVVSPLAVGFSERPDAATVAAVLTVLPVCFRGGLGWLVGGGSAHGRALGVSLVLDDQAAADPKPHILAGRKLLSAWESVRRRGLVEALEPKPLWSWAGPPADILDAAMLLEDLETADALSEELIARTENARAFEEPIEQLTTDLMTRGTAPLGPRASALLISRCLTTKRKIDESTAARLDHATVLSELRRYGSPPKRLPKSLPVPRPLRLDMWLYYLERLTGDVRKSLVDALDQLGPELGPQERQALVQAALGALPASEERLTDWSRFREDADLWPLLHIALRDEVLRRFRRNGKGAVDAYLVLGDDPGAKYARSVLRQEEVEALVTGVRALQKDYPQEAREWLAPLPKPPAPRIVEEPPRMERAREPKSTGAVREELEAVLFDSDGVPTAPKAEALRMKYEKLISPALKAEMEAMIETGCDARGRKFAESFIGEYHALGDVMAFLSEPSQKRLLECLEEQQGPKFKAQAALDLGHALKNRVSRNAYSAALGRYLLSNTAFRKQVAMRMVEDPRDLERKLKAMLSQKDGRG